MKNKKGQIPKLLLRFLAILIALGVIWYIVHLVVEGAQDTAEVKDKAISQVDEGSDFLNINEDESKDVGTAPAGTDSQLT